MTDEPVITMDSHVTLHYSVKGNSRGVILNTYAFSPATIQIGVKQIHDVFEKCLLGLPDGCEKAFHLPRAFGSHNPQLIHSFPRHILAHCEPLDIQRNVEFRSQEGHSVVGTLSHITPETVTVDFNHPLTGEDITFNVKIIAIF